MRPLIRLASYLYFDPPAKNNINVSTPVDAFRNSGAKALLSHWHDIGSAVVT